MAREYVSADGNAVRGRRRARRAFLAKRARTASRAALARRTDVASSVVDDGTRTSVMEEPTVNVELGHEEA
jgi:hypothetical protein